MSTFSEFLGYTLCVCLFLCMRVYTHLRVFLPIWQLFVHWKCQALCDNMIYLASEIFLDYKFQQPLKNTHMCV